MSKVWVNNGGKLYLSNQSKEESKLDVGVYMINVDEYGNFYLTKSSEGFNFGYKVYNLESDFIARVLRSYEATSGNLGLLLNGIKGTGKTVTAKIISNEVKQPTLLITSDIAKMNGLEKFLTTIEQDITIFVDEYEKIYRDSSKMLTIMDGGLDTTYRRLFLFTTNTLDIERNLKQRPSRLRYIKTFKDLPKEVVEEIIDDLLVNVDHKDGLITFIMRLELITVDIVKALISEVNIHDEDPFKFGDVFNVELRPNKFNIYLTHEGVKHTVGTQCDFMVTPYSDTTGRAIVSNYSIGRTKIKEDGTTVVYYENINLERLDREAGELVELLGPKLVGDYLEMSLTAELSPVTHSSYGVQYYGGITGDAFKLLISLYKASTYRKDSPDNEYDSGLFAMDDDCIESPNQCLSFLPKGS